MDGEFGKHKIHSIIKDFVILYLIILFYVQNYTVEVFSYPLCTLHPTRETVLIPSATFAEPFLPSDLGYLNEQLLLFSKVKHIFVSMQVCIYHGSEMMHK